MANEEHLARLKQGVAAWNEWRDKNPRIRPDLGEEDFLEPIFVRTNLNKTNLGGADLHEMDLREMDLHWANLIRTDLSRADLREANLYGADLGRANLAGADLTKATLTRVTLGGANLAGANTGWTMFGDVDLSAVRGLETVQHQGPSTIGIDTLYRSHSNIPEVLLRGAGVPDEMITYSKSLIGHPFQYYSCFISYSSCDDALAQRLHADLQAKGVRCWFAPEDLKIGDEFRSCIDESIQVYDRLLLV